MCNRAVHTKTAHARGVCVLKCHTNMANPSESSVYNCQRVCTVSYRQIAYFYLHSVLKYASFVKVYEAAPYNNKLPAAWKDASMSSL